MANYEDLILNSIEMVVQNALNNAKYDRTIQATILKCTDSIHGVYTAKYQDAKFTAYASNVEDTYANGDLVYILVPENNMASYKTILGTVKSIGTEYSSVILDSQRFFELGTNIITLHQEIGLNSYQCLENIPERYKNISLIMGTKISESGDIEYIEEKCHGLILYDHQLKTSQIRNIVDKSSGELIYIQVLKNDIELLTIDIAQLNLLYQNNNNLINNVKMGGLFRTELPEEQQSIPSDYGIYIEVEGIFNKAQKQKRFLTIGVNSMIGNPYQLWGNTEQINYKEINDFKITQINKIYFFGRNFPYKEDISDIDTKPNDIFLSKIYFSLCYQIKEEDFSSLNLWVRTPQGIYFKTDDGQNDTLLLDAIVRKGSKDYTDFDQTSFYWFEENAKIDFRAGYTAGYDFLGGDGWKCLNTLDVTQASHIPASSGYYIKKKDVEFEEKKYMCVATYDGVKLKKQITIYNYDATYKIALNSSRGTNFSKADTGGTEISVVLYKRNNFNWEEVSTSKYSIDWYTQDEYNNYQLRASDVTFVSIGLSEFSTNYAVNCAITLLDGSGCTGSSRIELFKGIKTDEKYSLIIDNKNSLFMYDENGISPIHKQNLENQISIIPLTYYIYNNETGEKIEGKDLPNDFAYWEFPKAEESLIVRTTDTEYNSEVSFNIADIYDPARNFNNMITLTVTYDGEKLINVTEILFSKQGENGTNGTAFAVKILPNLDYFQNQYFPVVPLNSNKEGFAPAQWSPLFYTNLFYNGILIFEGNTSGAPNRNTNIIAGDSKINIKWSFVKSSNKDLCVFQVNNKTGMFSVLNWESLFDEDKIENFPSPHLVNILQVEVEYKGLSCIATLPIATVIGHSSNEIYIKESTGIRYVVYKEDKTSPKYSSNPFFQIMKGKNEENITQWAAIGESYYNDGWHNNQELEITKDQNGNITLIPAKEYNGYALSNAVVGCNNNIIIHIPIHFMLNRYANKAINAWDGNKIVLDEENGAILAPQVIAGLKETDNSFTGVFMGTARHMSENDDVGLMAYSHGQRSFFLDAYTGTSIFGVETIGSIKIEPGKDPVIQSGNFREPTDEDSGEGLAIGFGANPYIIFGSKKFYVEPDGTMYAEGATINGDFEVYDEDSLNQSYIFLNERKSVIHFFDYKIDSEIGRYVRGETLITPEEFLIAGYAPEDYEEPLADKYTDYQLPEPRNSFTYKNGTLKLQGEFEAYNEKSLDQSHVFLNEEKNIIHFFDYDETEDGRYVKGEIYITPKKFLIAGYDPEDYEESLADKYTDYQLPEPSSSFSYRNGTLKLQGEFEAYNEKSNNQSHVFLTKERDIIHFFDYDEIEDYRYVRGEIYITPEEFFIAGYDLEDYEEPLADIYTDYQLPEPRNSFTYKNGTLKLQGEFEAYNEKSLDQSHVFLNEINPIIHFFDYKDDSEIGRYVRGETYITPEKILIAGYDPEDYEEPLADKYTDYQLPEPRSSLTYENGILKVQGEFEAYNEKSNNQSHIFLNDRTPTIHFFDYDEAQIGRYVRGETLITPEEFLIAGYNSEDYEEPLADKYTDYQLPEPRSSLTYKEGILKLKGEFECKTDSTDIAFKNNASSTHIRFQNTKKESNGQEKEDETPETAFIQNTAEWTPGRLFLYNYGAGVDKDGYEAYSIDAKIAPKPKGYFKYNSNGLAMKGTFSAETDASRIRFSDKPLQNYIKFMDIEEVDGKKYLKGESEWSPRKFSLKTYGKKGKQILSSSQSSSLDQKYDSYLSGEINETEYNLEEQSFSVKDRATQDIEEENGTVSSLTYMNGTLKYTGGITLSAPPYAKISIDAEDGKNSFIHFKNEDEKTGKWTSETKIEPGNFSVKTRTFDKTGKESLSELTMKNGKLRLKGELDMETPVVKVRFTKDAPQGNYISFTNLDSEDNTIGKQRMSPELFRLATYDEEGKIDSSFKFKDGKIDYRGDMSVQTDKGIFKMTQDKMLIRMGDTDEEGRKKTDFRLTPQGFSFRTFGQKEENKISELLPTHKTENISYYSKEDINDLGKKEDGTYTNLNIYLADFIPEDKLTEEQVTAIDAMFSSPTKEEENKEILNDLQIRYNEEGKAILDKSDLDIYSEYSFEQNESGEEVRIENSITEEYKEKIPEYLQVEPKEDWVEKSSLVYDSKTGKLRLNGNLTVKNDKGSIIFDDEMMKLSFKKTIEDESGNIYPWSRMSLSDEGFYLYNFGPQKKVSMEWKQEDGRLYLDRVEEEIENSWGITSGLEQQDGQLTVYGGVYADYGMIGGWSVCPDGIGNEQRNIMLGNNGSISVGGDVTNLAILESLFRDRRTSMIKGRLSFDVYNGDNEDSNKWYELIAKEQSALRSKYMELIIDNKGIRMKNLFSNSYKNPGKQRYIFNFPLSNGAFQKNWKATTSIKNFNWIQAQSNKNDPENPYTKFLKDYEAYQDKLKAIRNTKFTSEEKDIFNENYWNRNGAIYSDEKVNAGLNIAAVGLSGEGLLFKDNFEDKEVSLVKKNIVKTEVDGIPVIKGPDEYSNNIYFSILSNLDTYDAMQQKIERKSVEGLNNNILTVTEETESMGTQPFAGVVTGQVSSIRNFTLDDKELNDYYDSVIKNMKESTLKNKDKNADLYKFVPFTQTGCFGMIIGRCIYDTGSVDPEDEWTQEYQNKVELNSAYVYGTEIYPHLVKTKDIFLSNENIKKSNKDYGFINYNTFSLEGILTELHTVPTKIEYIENNEDPTRPRIKETYNTANIKYDSNFKKVVDKGPSEKGKEFIRTWELVLDSTSGQNDDREVIAIRLLDEKNEEITKIDLSGFMCSIGG